jgi:hypothetical protein
MFVVLQVHFQSFSSILILFLPMIEEAIFLFFQSHAPYRWMIYIYQVVSWLIYLRVAAGTKQFGG